MQDVSVIFNVKNVNRYACNVLAGALDHYVDSPGPEPAFADSVKDVIAKAPKRI